MPPCLPCLPCVTGTDTVVQFCQPSVGSIDRVSQTLLAVLNPMRSVAPLGVATRNWTLQLPAVVTLTASFSHSPGVAHPTLKCRSVGSASSPESYSRLALVTMRQPDAAGDAA